MVAQVRYRLALAALIPLLLSARADISRVRTPVTVDGLFATDSTKALYPLQYNVLGLWHYAQNPLTWRYESNAYEPIIEHQLMMELAAAIGVFRYFDVGVALPIALMQDGPTGAGLGTLSGAGVGDLRLVPRVQLLSERVLGVGLAFISEVTFPTGDAERFLGDPGVSWRPRAVASARLLNGRLRLLAGLGARVRRDVQVQGIELTDELDVRAGAAVPFHLGGLPSEASVELVGATPFKDPLGGGVAAMEVLGGLRTRLFGDWVVSVGGGTGITRGVGVPTFRVLLGVAYAPLPADRDGDGIPDIIDDCPDEPEDFDGFEDMDGCPDGGGDLEWEWEWVWEDEPEDEEECPEHFVRDEYGCSPIDSDGDGIPDYLDQCPDEKETINGYQDEDGCPDDGEGVTEYVEDKKIEIKETILFESGKAIIKPQSKKVLNEVALLILAHPEIRKIRIEGHTDSLGDEEDNLYLSQDRADAVRRYLIQRGVQRQRLEALGHGESRPIDTNDTAAGRARNRRVEFYIIDTRR